MLIDGLVDGTSYTVSVRAVSAAGPGATSTNTETGTPATYPQPVNAATVTANGENGQIAVSWTVPPAAPRRGRAPPPPTWRSVTPPRARSPGWSTARPTTCPPSRTTR
jgi:hypothetical protein